MALALQRDQDRLQASYAYVSHNRKNRSAPPRYYTPSRSSFVHTNKSETTTLHSIAFVSQFLFKALLICLVSIGFVYCASTIVGSSNSVLLKVIGLSAWSCGFVPLTYYLWNSKLAS